MLIRLDPTIFPMNRCSVTLGIRMLAVTVLCWGCQPASLSTAPEPSPNPITNDNVQVMPAEHGQSRDDAASNSDTHASELSQDSDDVASNSDALASKLNNDPNGDANKENEADIKSEYSPPVPLENLLPEFAQIVERCKRFDTPFVRFTIREDGSTEDHRFLRSTGCESADGLILTYVRRWKYVPATINGKPTDEEYTLAIHW